MKYELGPSERLHLTRFMKFMETPLFQDGYQGIRGGLELHEPNKVIEDYVAWLKAGEPPDWNREKANRAATPGM